MPNLFISLLFICCLSTACSAINPSAQQNCEEPRPEVCTREYVPVCAIKRNNTEGLYANACSACSNSEIIGYNEGACPKP